MCIEIPNILYIKYFYKKVQAKIYKKLDFFKLFLYNTLALILKAYILIYNFIFNMINIKKQWFTLVELIVVITILAILWSIAFISLQGYSSDARNSKRTSDLSSIQSSLTVKQTSGTDLNAFVDSNARNLLTTVPIAWVTNAPAGTYKAWTINYNALDMKQADFQDPQSNVSYAIWITTWAGWAYQIAASMEQSGWSKVARVVWNWMNRSATTYNTVATWSTVVLNSPGDVNRFKLGDTLNLWGAITWTVNRVSADGMTLTLSTGSTSTAIRLNFAESEGLIGSGSTILVKDNLSVLPY